MNMENKKAELEFPVTWRYRAVVDGSSLPDSINMLSAILRSFGQDGQWRAEQASSSGKYQSFSAEVTFPDRETMEKISSALQGVPGVRFLL